MKLYRIHYFNTENQNRYEVVAQYMLTKKMREIMQSKGEIISVGRYIINNGTTTFERVTEEEK